MIRLKIISITLFLLLVHMCNGQPVIKKYIEHFLPIANTLSAEFGIPVSIILGVSTLESGSGTSRNCRLLNNYFGITGKNHLKGHRSAYKQYPTAEASFRDFCEILSRKPFYAKLKNNMEYSKWLSSMNHASYAGAKNVWITRITSIIKKHRLYQYDKK